MPSLLSRREEVRLLRLARSQPATAGELTELIEEIKDRTIWKEIVKVYNRKYGGDVGPLLESSGGCVFRVRPQVAFGQDEHATNFSEAMTRWHFSQR